MKFSANASLIFVTAILFTATLVACGAKSSDEEQLRGILLLWERSPEAIQGTDAEANRLRLERRIAQIEEQMELLAGVQAELKESPMWQLKQMVDDEAAKGKDLVKDMVRRLKRDILVATNRLDALRPPG